MSAGVILLEAAVFCALFTVMAFATTGKKSQLQVHNYPPEIQEEYFKHHARIETAPLSARVVLIKGLGILAFTVVLAVMGYLAGARTFWQGFLVSFGLMAVVGLYDTLFLDWVLFANMQRFRLEGTEHMDEAYHQKWFHLKGMLFPGIVFALIPAALDGLILALIGG